MLSDHHLTLISLAIAFLPYHSSFMTADRIAPGPSGEAEVQSSSYAALICLGMLSESAHNHDIWLVPVSDLQLWQLQACFLLLGLCISCLCQYVLCGKHCHRRKSKLLKSSHQSRMLVPGKTHIVDTQAKASVSLTCLVPHFQFNMSGQSHITRRAS